MTRSPSPTEQSLPSRAPIQAGDAAHSRRERTKSRASQLETTRLGGVVAVDNRCSCRRRSVVSESMRRVTAQNQHWQREAWHRHRAIRTSPNGSRRPLPTRKDMAAATVADLAQPWSAKEFDFFNPLTHAHVPAMIVRLPGSPSRGNAYWAFSLEAPYETCRLRYVTDLRELASRFHYRAGHPWCGFLRRHRYDPLQLGTTPAGAWVRGEVAQGAGQPSAARYRSSCPGPVNHRRSHGMTTPLRR